MQQTGNHNEGPSQTIITLSLTEIQKGEHEGMSVADQWSSIRANEGLCVWH